MNYNNKLRLYFKPVINCIPCNGDCMDFLNIENYEDSKETLAEFQALKVRMDKEDYFLDGNILMEGLDVVSFDIYDVYVYNSNDEMYERINYRIPKLDLIFEKSSGYTKLLNKIKKSIKAK